MNLLKLGGLIGLVYVGRKVLARQSGSAWPRRLPDATPSLAPAGAGIGNPAERLNAARLSAVPAGGGLSGSSSQSGSSSFALGVSDWVAADSCGISVGCWLLYTSYAAHEPYASVSRTRLDLLTSTLIHSPESTCNHITPANILDS